MHYSFKGCNPQTGGHANGIPNQLINHPDSVVLLDGMKKAKTGKELGPSYIPAVKSLFIFRGGSLNCRKLHAAYANPISLFRFLERIRPFFTSTIGKERIFGFPF